MTMDKAEITIDYRRAANKQRQIKILAELNQCAERKIAEILVDAGEELPKKYQEMLLKPSRRSWKFPEEPEAPETEPPEAPEATEPAPMTAEAVPAPVPEADPTAEVTVDLDAWDYRAQLIPAEIPGITDERLLRAACRMLTSALDLEPPAFHRYSAGVLDLVHALLDADG